LNTATSTATSTATATSYLQSTLGRNVIGPVPAQAGSDVCLYSTQPVISSKWSVYNVSGQFVADVTFGSSPAQCWKTQGVARGLYYVRLVMTLPGGQTVTEWHPVVLQ
jgi:hypothetical protein